MQILTEGRKEFLAWAGENGKVLLDKFLKERSKYYKSERGDDGEVKRVPMPEADMDWWVKNKTPKDLEDFMDNYVSKNQKEKQQMIEGADVLYDDGRWLCMHVKTYECAAKYGSGTCWCITGRYSGYENDKDGRRFFNNYLEHYYSGYYFVIDRKGTDRNGQGGKWCVCPDKFGNKWTIWDSKDGTPKYIPNIPYGIKVPGVITLTQFNVDENGTLIGLIDNSTKEIEIPSNVKRIKQKLFKYNNTITTVSLPESVEEIGAGAFMGCSNLTYVLGLSCKKVGVGAFIGCTNLFQAVLNDATRLEDRVFAYCDSLSEVVLGDVNYVSPTAFEEAGNEKNPMLIQVNKIGDEDKAALEKQGFEVRVRLIKHNV